jgi:hypothetical protein
MRHLFDPNTAVALKERLARLTPTTAPQWGRMHPAQAMAHCAAALEIALGERRPPRVFVGRLLGPLVKWLALRDDAPMRRNSPTVPSLIVTDERELNVERDRLLQLIDRFAAAGPAGCATHPHSFFGPLTPAQWAVLQYKHLDHHLRQFAV